MMDFGYPQTTESKILQEWVCLFATTTQKIGTWDQGEPLGNMNADERYKMADT